MRRAGFTLIELLTVIVVITILFTIIAFAATGARGNARDERRRADLIELASGLEVFRAECGSYPATITAGASLRGNGATSTCVASSIYLTEVPRDPESPSKNYSYNLNPLTGKYVLCAALEVAPASSSVANCTASCGNGVTCNYSIVSP